MERTIRVTGTGKVSIKPDITVIPITQTKVCLLYAEALKCAADDKEDLSRALVEIGFKKEDLKTTYFDIDSKYQYYTDKDGNSESRFVGYKYTHKMKLKFKNDNKVLGHVLYAIANSSGTPEFSIEYTTSKPEKAKNLILQKAVEDSKKKAEIMAKAAGVTLGDVLLIDYSWGEVTFSNRPVRDFELDDLCLAAKPIDMDIEPDDIDGEDTVTVVWSIK